jgi:uncharacterized protein with PhoU and TrkA domain|tara:strand:- start:200 stop:535 length:336 start_codon:yes stop_codon:yes gene_type:complete
METNDLFLDNYLTNIKEDYKRFIVRAGILDTNGQMDRIKEFSDNLTTKFGSKYIKVMNNGSAHSFIVNTDKDKKFKKGDVLMAASWASPARNFARGNLFTPDSIKARWMGL